MDIDLFRKILEEFNPIFWNAKIDRLLQESKYPNRTPIESAKFRYVIALQDLNQDQDLSAYPKSAADRRSILYEKNPEKKRRKKLSRKARECLTPFDQVFDVLRKKFTSSFAEEVLLTHEEFIRNFVGTAKQYLQWMELLVCMSHKDFWGNLSSVKAEDMKKPQKKGEQENFVYEAYIKKGRGFGFGGKPLWEFGFGGKKATVDSSLKGLVLIEFLLIHRNNEYTPLKLLQETGQRGKEETESEKIYTDKDIEIIKEAIDGLKSRRELSSDTEEKARLEQEIIEAENELSKSRNCFGKSKKFSDKNIKAVSRPVQLIKDKIAPQNTKLYNHLNTFLHTGTLCYYKPDTDIFWQIYEKNQ